MSDEDWEHREVCPNGACIGVIGPDGLCKVCGRAAPNWGSERMRGLAADAAAPDDDAEGDERDDGDDGDERAVRATGDGAPAASASGGDDWDRRELCANGACIGVIGASGTCTVCGAPREAPARGAE